MTSRRQVTFISVARFLCSSYNVTQFIILWEKGIRKFFDVVKQTGLNVPNNNNILISNNNAMGSIFIHMACRFYVPFFKYIVCLFQQRVTFTISATRHNFIKITPRLAGYAASIFYFIFPLYFLKQLS